MPALQKPPHTCISLIAAVAENRVIGCQQDLPWQLPRDQAYFNRTVKGAPMIMGRVTAESSEALYSDFKNIIVTSRNSVSVPYQHEICDSTEAALKSALPASEIFIAGGAEIYRQFLPMADRLYITRVHAQPAGDTFFPEVDWEEWECYFEEAHPADAKHTNDFTFLRFQRNQQPVK